MSALSRAPAPASGVRWAHPLTPLEYALTDCYLSYKQSALLPPLCFQLLADSFAFPKRVKPFKIKQIQTLLTKHPGWGCLRTVRSVLGTPCSLCCAFSYSWPSCVFSNLQPLFLSLPSFSSSWRLFSQTYSLFWENTRGGGGCCSFSPLVTRHAPLATSLCSLGVEPMLDMWLKEAEGDSALLQDGVMERADAEFGGEAALGFGAQLADFELAEFVGQRLAGPDDVAVDFDGDVLIGLAGVLLEKLNGLVARPVHRMHPSVDHQAYRAPHLVAELAEFRVWIGVQADVFAEALAVQRPALDKRRVAEVLAKLRRVFHFLRQRNLQMVPGDRFMQRERFHFPLGPRVQIVRIDEIAAGPPGLRRTRLIVSGGLRGRLEIGNGADAVRQARQLAEKMRQAGIDALGDDAVAVHKIVRLVVVETRIGAQKFGEVVEAALKFRGGDDAIHLRANALYFGQSDFMNLLRREAGRGLPADMKGVHRRAIRQGRGGDVFAASRKIGRGDVVAKLVERRRDRGRVNALGFFGEPRAVGFRKVGRKFGEGLQQRAGQRIGRSEVGDLLGQVA